MISKTLPAFVAGAVLCGHASAQFSVEVFSQEVTASTTVNGVTETDTLPALFPGVGGIAFVNSGGGAVARHGYSVEQDIYGASVNISALTIAAGASTSADTGALDTSIRVVTAGVHAKLVVRWAFSGTFGSTSEATVDIGNDGTIELDAANGPAILEVPIPFTGAPTVTTIATHTQVTNQAGGLPSAIGSLWIDVVPDGVDIQPIPGNCGGSPYLFLDANFDQGVDVSGWSPVERPGALLVGLQSLPTPLPIGPDCPLYIDPVIALPLPNAANLPGWRIASPTPMSGFFQAVALDLQTSRLFGSEAYEVVFQ